MLSFSDLRNESKLDFVDISSEEYRIYIKDNTEIKISNPIALNVSRSGGHRLLNSEGLSYYIPSGWSHLVWKAKDDCPHFVK